MFLMQQQNTMVDYLHQAHDNLSDLLGMERADWDGIIHMSDELLDEMGYEYAITHAAPNTTPLYV